MKTSAARKVIICIFICGLFFVLSSVFSFAASIIHSGDCNGTISWELDSDGVLYIKGTGDMPFDKMSAGNGWGWNEFESDITSVVIGSGIERVGNDFFTSTNSINSVTFSDTVYYCGTAFMNCSKLTSVNITSPQAWAKISFNQTESNPLYYAKNLYMDGNLVTEIVLAEDQTSLSYSLCNCESIKKVVIPDNVVTIYGGALSGCNNLEELFLSFVGGNANYEKGSQREHQLGYIFGEKNYTGAVKIAHDSTASGESYFYIPQTLKSVSVSGGSICYGAFSNCSMIETITLSGISPSIDSCAFSNCTNLKNFVIPEGVESLGANVFSNCINLLKMNFPSSINCVGDNLFIGCTSLSGIYITDLEAWCKIAFPSSDYPLSVVHNLYLNYELLEDLVIPNTLTQILPYSFAGCECIKTVTIPESICHIGFDAFEGCINLSGVYISNLKKWCEVELDSDVWGDCENTNPLSYAKKLYLNNVLVEDLIIPDGVTQIHRGTFCHCENLLSIVIPSSVTNIDEKAFENCSNLVQLSIPFIGPSKNISEGEAIYPLGYYFKTLNYASGGIIQYSYYAAGGHSAQEYAIPNSLKQIIFTGEIIPKGAFCNCAQIESFVLKGTTVTISDSAFYNCSSLEHIYYVGDEADFESVIEKVGTNNSDFLNASTHFNSIESNDNKLVASIDSNRITVSSSFASNVNGSIAVAQYSGGRLQGIVVHSLNSESSTFNVDRISDSEVKIFSLSQMLIPRSYYLEFNQTD